jgi:nesprin-1
MVAKWQNISDDHKNFNNKLAEFETWLDTLESKPAQILDDDDLDLNKKLSQLQSIYGSSDQTSVKISLLTSLGERLYPDTSAAGRETIRQQLKDIRDRYKSIYQYVSTKYKIYLRLLICIL